MNCPDNIATILIEIIRCGILHARAAGWQGDAKRAALEADHIHNLPELLKDYKPENLEYYWNIERPGYIASVDSSTYGFEEAFLSLWQQLESIVSEIPPGE